MIVALTVIANIILSCLLISREAYIRYGWLTVSCILSVFCDVALQFAHTRLNYQYDGLLTTIFFVFLILNFFIIWESFRVGNKCVRIPVEVQLGIEFAAFLAKKAGFLWTWYYLAWGTRFTNLGMILFWCWCFSIKEIYEGRKRL